jgi:hypothetical protein
LKIHFENGFEVLEMFLEGLQDLMEKARESLLGLRTFLELGLSRLLALLDGKRRREGSCIRNSSGLALGISGILGSFELFCAY